MTIFHVNQQTDIDMNICNVIRTMFLVCVCVPHVSACNDVFCRVANSMRGDYYSGQRDNLVI